MDITELVGDYQLNSNLINMKPENKFDFLFAPRFWALVVGSANGVVIDPSFPTQPWYISLSKFLVAVSVGFIGIRTVDRYSDKKVEAAEAQGKTTTVTLPEGVSSVKASTEGQ